MAGLKKYFAIVKAVMENNLAYIGATYVGIIFSVFQVVLMYYLWKIIFSNQDVIEGMTFSQMTTYIIISKVLSLQFSYGIDVKISDDIYNGSIIQDLLLPINYKVYLLWHKLGETLFFFLFRYPLILIISISFIGFSTPSNFSNFILFFIFLVLSAILLYYIEFIVGLIAIFTLNKYSVRTIKEGILLFFSGALIPLQFLPDSIERIVNIMPFKYIISVPANTYLGLIDNKSIILTIVLELLWIIILFIVSNAFYRYSMKKIIIQGG